MLYRINGKVNVDKRKLRYAIRKDVVDHLDRFSSAEARDLNLDLDGILPAEEINELTAMLQRSFDYIRKGKPVDNLVNF